MKNKDIEIQRYANGWTIEVNDAVSSYDDRPRYIARTRKDLYAKIRWILSQDTTVESQGDEPDTPPEPDEQSPTP